MYKENDNLDTKKIEEYMKMPDDERKKLLIEKENEVREHISKISIQNSAKQ